VIIRNSVDLPAPFGPMTPTMPPGGSVKRQVVDQQLVAEGLGDALGLDHLAAQPLGHAGMTICALSIARLSVDLRASSS